MRTEYVYQLKKLNHRHEEILMWLMLNPNKPQGLCAEELGYTQGWVSQIITSDLFQLRIAELRSEDFEVAVLSIREKLNAVASLGLDKLLDKLEVETDMERIRSTTDSAIKRLGYGVKVPEAPANNAFVQNNNYFLTGASKKSLEAARDLLTLKNESTQPLTTEDDQERDKSGLVTNRRLAIEGISEEIVEAP